jgi:MerR family transcriptional regulator, mercuric resistance operon regulatory protein
MAAGMTIGKLANTAGVNIETVRYYQRLGLLDEPTKPADGYRRYTAQQARRLQFIKRAQGLGFTLSEIAGLLKLDDDSACADTRELAARKLALIEQRMADLAVMKEMLTGLIRQCDAGGSGKICPIIDLLAAP